MTRREATRHLYDVNDRARRWSDQLSSSDDAGMVDVRRDRFADAILFGIILVLALGAFAVALIIGGQV